jgi:hypothetical protein
MGKKLFKIWVAVAFAWAIFVVGLMQFIGLWGSADFSDNSRLFIILWGIPSLVVLVVGAVFRWAFT